MPMNATMETPITVIAYTSVARTSGITDEKMPPITAKNSSGTRQHATSSDLLRMSSRTCNSIPARNATTRCNPEGPNRQWTTAARRTNLRAGAATAARTPGTDIQ